MVVNLCARHHWRLYETPFFPQEMVLKRVDHEVCNLFFCPLIFYNVISITG